MSVSVVSRLGERLNSAKIMSRERANQSHTKATQIYTVSCSERKWLDCVVLEWTFVLLLRKEGAHACAHIHVGGEGKM